jgi:8-oxo-dGTP pyrophosphatase MutT (NUDIX family)
MKSNSYQVFFTPPQDFTPTMHAAGCYVVYEGRILILQRHPEKFQGSTWGVPGGKLEPKEDALSAVVREVYEEVGISIPRNQLNYLGPLFVRLKHLDYIFEIFSCRCTEMPQVILEKSEHTEYGWFTLEQARELDLIQGGLEALDFFHTKVNA